MYIYQSLEKIFSNSNTVVLPCTRAAPTLILTNILSTKYSNKIICKYKFWYQFWTVYEYHLTCVTYICIFTQIHMPWRHFNQFRYYLINNGICPMRTNWDTRIGTALPCRCTHVHGNKHLLIVTPLCFHAYIHITTHVHTYLATHTHLIS